MRFKALPLVVGKYFVLGLFYYVFPYHETGLLKWLPANEGCPAKSEVLLVGFCIRLYGDNLAMSEGYLLLPNTVTLIARLSHFSLVQKPTKSTSFGFPLVSEKVSG